VTRNRQVLFIQGGGHGAHDEWDDKLVDSLQREIGEEFDVRYPRMPWEDEPNLRTWGPAIRQELGMVADGVVLVAHSVGATILMQELLREPPERKVGGIVLLSAPFPGVGGWPGDQLPLNLGDLLPRDAPVHLFHGAADHTVPPSHAGMYSRAIPQAHVHLLPGRDHQLGNDMAEVAAVIRDEVR